MPGWNVLSALHDIEREKMAFFKFCRRSKCQRPAQIEPAASFNGRQLVPVSLNVICPAQIMFGGVFERKVNPPMGTWVVFKFVSRSSDCFSFTR